MIITKIEKQKNNPKRVSIFVDSEFAFGLLESDIKLVGLQEGMEIGQEALDDILENVVLLNAKNAALKFLSYKDRTESEVLGKLQSLSFHENVVEETISFLRKYNYINDKRYTEKYMKDKIKKHGFLKIKYDLMHKGIDEFVLDEVSSELDLDEVASAYRLLCKKVRNVPPNPGEKNKLYQYLARKGFSYDLIHDAIRMFFAQHDGIE